MKPPDPHSVAITGAGLVSCFGAGAEAAWESICQGRTAMTPLWRCESPLPPGRTGGQVPDEDEGNPDAAPREARLLRKAIDLASTHAGLFRPGAPRPDRIAVVMGTTLHGMRRAGEFLRTDRTDRLREFLAAPALLSALRGLPISGPVLSNCSACSSGLASVALAVTLLESGQADAVIAGGYDPVSEYAVGGFGALRLLARDALRPFCTGRDGMKLSEGYAALILERTQAALARRAPVSAYVRGYGESSDAHHLTQPHPQGTGAARAIDAALKDAALDPGAIGLIATHATGTPNNDASEAAALRAVFGASLNSIPAVAFKSHLGHTLGAAGAAELILSLESIRRGTIPPTANVAPSDLEFPDLALNTGAPKAAPVRTALNLSLGFGGANTCVVVSSDPAGRRSLPPRDVLITGVGIVLPGVVDAASLRSRLAAAESVRADTGTISEDHIAPLVNTRRVRRLSDYVKVSLAAAAAACRDAGVENDAAFMGSCHAVLGTMIGSTSYCEAYYREIVTAGIEAANPMLFAEGVPNAGAAHLSLALGITGSCQSIIGSRTAGLDALGIARARIACGLWDRAIVGAGEEYSTLVNRCLDDCGIRSTTPGEPFGLGLGAPIGAGAVALVLESRSSVERRGATARAMVLETASRACTEGLRSAHGVQAVRHALEAVQSPPTVVSSAHGSWLDAVEARGIALALGRGAVGSPVGHFAETLSVTPLCGLAVYLLTGAPPALRSSAPALPGALRALRPDEKPDRIAILATDPSGLAAAATVSRPN